jgi:hypothetical protein
MTAPLLPPPVADQVRIALDQARQTALQIDTLRAANARTIRTLEAAFNGALNGASSPPSILSQGHAEHRRAHRRGYPARIAADPELQAFILARIDRLTFAQIVDEVKAHFPPDRQTSQTAISRWWNATRPPGRKPAEGGRS